MFLSLKKRTTKGHWFWVPGKCFWRIFIMALSPPSREVDPCASILCAVYHDTSSLTTFIVKNESNDKNFQIILMYLDREHFQLSGHIRIIPELQTERVWCTIMWRSGKLVCINVAPSLVHRKFSGAHFKKTRCTVDGEFNYLGVQKVST